MGRVSKVKLTREVLRQMASDSAEDPTRRRIQTDSAVRGFVAVALGGAVQLAFRYSIGGKIRQMGLGKWAPSMTAAEVERLRQLAREWAAERAAGRDPVLVLAERERETVVLGAEAVTVKAAVERYLGALRSGERRKRRRPARASTLAALEARFRIVLDRWGDRPIRSISEDEIRALHSEIGEGRHRADGRPAPVQADRIVAALSALYGFLKVPNPCREVLEAGFGEQSKRRALTKAEVERLGEVLRRAEAIGAEWEARAEEARKAERKKVPAKPKGFEFPGVILAVRLALLTGCRRSELVGFGEIARRDTSGLLWESVDLERGVLTVKLDKAGRTRQVLLGRAAVELLRKAPKSSAWVCPGRSPAGPVVGLDKARIRLFEAAGIEAGPGERVDFHSLRTTFGSRAAEVNGSSLAAGVLLGHRLAEGATSRYVDPSAMEAARGWAERTCAALAADLGLEPERGVVVPFPVPAVVS